MHITVNRIFGNTGITIFNILKNQFSKKKLSYQDQYKETIHVYVNITTIFGTTVKFEAQEAYLQRV